jgi:hypothetical protein
MQRKDIAIGVLLVFSAVLLLIGLAGLASPTLAQSDDPILENAQRMIEEGRQTFRFDTFGDEAYWGDSLQLHQAIAGEANGGVG